MLFYLFIVIVFCNITLMCQVIIYLYFVISRSPGVSCDWHYASGWCTICRQTQRWAWCQRTRATRSVSEASVLCRVPGPATWWPPTYRTPLATQELLRASAAASRRLCRYEVWSSTFRTRLISKTTWWHLFVSTCISQKGLPAAKWRIVFQKTTLRLTVLIWQSII